jgi:TPR repeat protein
MALRTCIGLALALLAAGASAADLEEGLRSYKAKDYPAAAQLLTRAAEVGSAQAQSILGWMNLMGEGMHKDAVRAAAWYRKAALQGNGSAQYNLGLLYGNGEGVKQDLGQALYWFRKAAEQGDPRAKDNVALIEARQRVVEGEREHSGSR